MTDIGGLGWIKDPPDEHDYRWRALVLREEAPTPLSARLRGVGPVLDQEQTPHCVAFTSASVKLYEERVDHHHYYGFDPADLYGRCKEIDGFPGEDGTIMRAAGDVMRSVGIRAVVSGVERRYKIAQYIRCESLQQIREAIAIARGPVGLGMAIDDAWRTSRIGADGRIGEPTGNILGGHEIEVIGYDDSLQALEVKNSWGQDWGSALGRSGYSGGFAWLPYTHLDHYSDWDAWKFTDSDEAL